jgi:hypothetical protein
VSDLDGLHNQDFELCLDGFIQTEITNVQNFRKLASFRLLATSVKNKCKNNEISGRGPCFIPFWLKSDLNKIGSALPYTERDINEQYYYSGGSLRNFLSGTNATRFAINQAVAAISMHTAELLSTDYSFVSASQVDQLRMTLNLDVKCSDCIFFPPLVAYFLNNVLILQGSLALITCMV